MPNADAPPGDGQGAEVDEDSSNWILLQRMMLERLAQEEEEEVREGGDTTAENQFGTEMVAKYGKKFTASAYAKRHGWNECDGAFVKAKASSRSLRKRKREEEEKREGVEPKERTLVTTLETPCLFRDYIRNHPVFKPLWPDLPRHVTPNMLKNDRTAHHWICSFKDRARALRPLAAACVAHVTQD